MTTRTGSTRVPGNNKMARSSTQIYPWKTDSGGLESSWTLLLLLLLFLSSPGDSGHQPDFRTTF